LICNVQQIRSDAWRGLLRWILGPETRYREKRPSKAACAVCCSQGRTKISKKIYRLKEDQAFSLSLELGRREKFARHPSADILLHSVGGGGDFVDTVIAF
jgi:hypothetical protein